MTTINSHTGFQPLKEVWLGDTYPDHFFDHLKNHQLRDLCLQVSDMTRKDLSLIQAKLESFGVKVCRPNFDHGIDAYLDDQDNLLKPPICPRDWAITLADTLYILPQYPSGVQPWHKDLDRYRDDGQKVKILSRFTDDPEPWCYLVYPSFVRMGIDLFIDYNKRDHVMEKNTMLVAHELAKDYRVHVSGTGEHADAIFCPVRPGQIVTSHYRNSYDIGWPGWDVLSLPNTTRGNGGGGKWFIPGVNYSHFNETLLCPIVDWVGDSRETVFEVNMLVIDESNSLCLAYDEKIKQQLESRGIHLHATDFRARGFWDGGLHCLTLDIQRQGTRQDYWPGRGAPGIYFDS